MYNYQTNNPLYKGFTCPYCEKDLRTRQGLSGHIHFKHGIKQNTLDNDIELVKGKFEVAVITLGLNEITTQMIEAILENWDKIMLICGELGIDLNKQDFKNYFVTMLANVYNQD
jgi:glutaredoxin